MQENALKAARETSYSQLDAAGIVAVHETSLEILAKVGIRVESPEAVEVFRRAGAANDGNIIFLTASLLNRTLTSAPSVVTLAGHDGHPDLEVGGTRSFAGTGGAALQVLDLESDAVRPATLRDIYQIARLVDQLEHIDFFVRPVIPRDIPEEGQDLNQYYAALAGTRKHVMAAVSRVESARRAIRLAALLCGGRDRLREKPVISFITSCCVSPLTLDRHSTEIMAELVRQEMPVVIGSAPMAGSTAPVTLAGTLAQMNAELLAGIALSQLINPGAPVIYGAVPAIADMHSGGFSGGAVEFGMLNGAAAQMAQFYDLPVYTSAGVTDSRTPDIQAGYEKAFSLLQLVHSGANLIHHAAGMLDSLKSVAYEQYVIDNDIIGMARRADRGIKVDRERLALEVIRDIGHHGSFLTHKHTRRYLRKERIFLRLGDRDNPKGEKGEWLDARQRARRQAQELLAAEPVVHIPPEIDRQLRQEFEILL
ncbi:trimethylamine methyltransferase family protein [Desulfurivibrio alkaliphilus]|uniref:Trimethylamine methyltransferase n=1 Tax=Desulfurivibrio alkaliphilus (strain DSM 19089 / UNIQEM U267 / AHT2) TaxID=589865 RepID=D6Z0X8_DESAT|nr:trimethylamine methyltransferase family protein [Desulfurivibrio alkaliphilus]ADH87238.1 trimethylamine methyltransferase [Desulfurivibrio alkaliphilus AHT 2]